MQHSQSTYYKKKAITGIQLKNLSLSAPDGEPIISNIEGDFGAGKLHAVLGASGVGKSTMMRAIAGVWPWVSSGEVIVPKSVSNLYFIPQKYILGPLTINQYFSTNGPAQKQDIENMLQLGEANKIPQVEDAVVSNKLMVDIWGKSLSGGEHQRMALAKIMARTPHSLILVDEGFSAMPPGQEKRLLTAIKQLIDPTSVYLFSMHSRANLELFDHVWELDKGGLVPWKP
jgi:putative ATP-binding cassette transporter